MKSFSIFILALLLLAAGCGGSGSGGGGLGLSRVKVETGNVGQATIGPAGGVVTATGSDGAIYTLTLPQDAVDENTLIKIYPVSSISGTPFSEGVYGGFHMEPSGLVFGEPASMTVTLPPSIDPATYKPFLYTGDGEDIHFETATINGQDVTFVVSHFSGGGGGKGSGTPAPQSAEAIAKQAIFAHVNIQVLANEPLDPQFIAGILLDWYQSSIKPGLLATMPVEARMPDVFREWKAWLAYIESGPWGQSVRLLIAQQLVTEVLEADGLAASAIRGVFDDANAQSAAVESLERVKVALYWYRHAVLYDVDHLENMGIDQIRDDLACKLVVQSESFPDPITAGQAGNLDITVGYRFDNGPVRFTKMVSTISHSGTTETTQNIGVTSNSSGRLQRNFTRESAANDLTLDAEVSFEDIKLRTIANRDYPHPIINTEVHVIRAGSGSGFVKGDFVGQYMDDNAIVIDRDGVESILPFGLYMYVDQGKARFVPHNKGQDGVWRPWNIGFVEEQSVSGNTIVAYKQTIDDNGQLGEVYTITATFTTQQNGSKRVYAEFKQGPNPTSGGTFILRKINIPRL